MNLNKRSRSFINNCLQRFARFAVLSACVFIVSISGALTRSASAFDPHFRLPWRAGDTYGIGSGSYSYAQGDHFDYSNPLYKDYYAIDFGLGCCPGKDVAAAQGGNAVSGSDGAYGLYVEIDHGNGFSTVYAHLDSISIQNGSVTQGTIIGTSGCTGTGCRGAHLHFSARFTDGGGTKHGYMPEPMSGYTGFGRYGENRGASPPYTNNPQLSNVVQNYSFETDIPIMREWGGPWQRVDGVNYNRLFDIVDGVWYLQTNRGSVPSGNYASVWQDFPAYENDWSNYTTGPNGNARPFVNPPDTWTVRARMRSPNCAANGRLYGWALWGATFEAGSTPFVLTNQWRIFTATTRFSRNDHNLLRVEIYLDNTDPNCQYDIDYVTLQRNYINNSSFENDPPPNTTSGDWILWTDQACSPNWAFYDSSVRPVKDDTRVLETNRGSCSTGYMGVYQSINNYVAAGDGYHARVWVRLPFGEGASGHLRLWTLWNTMHYEDRIISIGAGDTNWYEYTVDMTIQPADARNNVMYAALYLDTYGVNYDFDGFQVWGGAGN